MRMILLGAIGAVFLFSCGEAPKTASHSTPKKAWDDANDPFIMDAGFIKSNQYTQKFADLPLKGELKKIPWTDDYWPTSKGGISYRWNDTNHSEDDRYAYALIPQQQLPKIDMTILSPSEKLDIFLGRKDWAYTKMERARTEILKTVSSNSHYDPNFEIPDWEGLCHAWAPATLFFDEPGSVNMKSKSGVEVPFGSSDIKALLVYFLNEADAPSLFLGTRCEADIDELKKSLRNRLISRRYFDEQLESCSGVNAGAFHIVIANQIGRMDEGFIVDVDPGPEVWNQPVYGFSTQVVKEKSGASPGAARGTVKEIEIKTRMFYKVEVDQSWDRQVEDGKAHKDYHYKIEIDVKGNIIGGVWLEADHPDFAWKQALPTFYGDFSYVKEIYEAAVGHKVPENLMRIKPKPTNKPPRRGLTAWFGRRH